MTIPEPFPELQEILTAIGEAGQRLSDIDASEGAAGNISVFIGWPMEVRRLFPLATEIDLPVRVPHLVGRLFFITGSGRRLRDILSEPTVNLAAIVINEAVLPHNNIPGRAVCSHASPLSSILIWQFTRIRFSVLTRISMP